MHKCCKTNFHATCLAEALLAEKQRNESKSTPEPSCPYCGKKGKSAPKILVEIWQVFKHNPERLAAAYDVFLEMNEADQKMYRNNRWYVCETDTAKEFAAVRR